MPAERTAMRHVREVLRLKFVGGLPIREIARRVGIAASTVRGTLGRFEAAGLSWPVPKELTDSALEAKLFAAVGTKQGHRRQVEPDWASIQRELKRKRHNSAVSESRMSASSAMQKSAHFRRDHDSLDYRRRTLLRGGLW